MKIIQTPELPKFNPVTVVFETAAELQYVTKMLGMARYDIGEAFTGVPDFDSSVSYCLLSDECEKQGISFDDNHLFYIEKGTD